METLNRLADPCRCGSERCLGCGNHISNEPSGACAGCRAADAEAAGTMSQAEASAICLKLDEEERRGSACPECSGGRACSDLCERCQEKEQADEASFEREHAAGNI